MEELLELLRRLTALNATSGYEQEVADFIKNTLDDAGIGYYQDRLGNIIAQQGQTPNRIALFAHMDEVGFGVRGITDDGMLKFAAIGGVTDKILASAPVVVGCRRIRGVIGNIPKHLQEKTQNRELKIADMFIDIGATDLKNALEYVKIGDPVYWQSDFVEFGDGSVKAKALDDRAGVAVILYLLLQKKYSFTACFTTREEIGILGAKMTVGLIQPEKALVLDVTTCADMPGVTEKTTLFGQGVALSVLDGGSVADVEWTKTVADIACRRKISHQKKLTTKGGTDAGAVSYYSGGVVTAGLSLPGRYIHSPVSVISKDDFFAMYQLVDAVLEEV